MRLYLYRRNARYPWFITATKPDASDWLAGRAVGTGQSGMEPFESAIAAKRKVARLENEGGLDLLDRRVK